MASFQSNLPFLHISDLERLNLPSSLLSYWDGKFDSFRDDVTGEIPLTQLQSHVFAHPKTFLPPRHNLVVVGPTSTGKTLIAQTIVAEALQGPGRSRALYLVPLRALVTEKYLDFRGSFEDRKVIPASSDYPWGDGVIRSRDWHIAVAVHDKAYRWLSDEQLRNRILHGIDVIVVDEIQVLEHNEQGPRLEGLLAFLKWVQTERRSQSAKPRIVVLTTNFVVAESVAEWLNAEVVPAPNVPISRPVPLYEGFYPLGRQPGMGPVLRLKTTGYGSASGIEAISIPDAHRQEIRSRAVPQIARRLRELDIPTVVFVSDEQAGRQVAQQLSRHLPKHQPSSGLTSSRCLELEQLEPSPYVELLRETCQAGVACAFDGMTSAELELVSREFSWCQEDTSSLRAIVASRDAFLPQLPSKLKDHLLSSQPKRGRDQLTVSLASQLVNDGLRIIVYVAVKGDVPVIASRIAKQLRCDGSAEIHQALRERLERLEESPVRDLLLNTLPAGVAFHHGDMTAAERQLVEEGFRASGDEPPIRLVIATPTLGMGINLPADVVLMRDHHTFDGRLTAEQQSGYVKAEPTRKLTSLEYSNYAGRAGRLLSQERQERFGLCLIIDSYNSQIERYLSGQIEPLNSCLTDSAFGIEPHILTFLAAVRGAEAESEPFKWAPPAFMKNTYAWHTAPDQRGQLATITRFGVERLKRMNLGTDEGELTDLGVVAARHFVSTETIATLLGVAERLPELWPHYPAELLWELAGVPEARANYPSAKEVSTKSRKSVDPREKMQEELGILLSDLDLQRQCLQGSTLSRFVEGDQVWPDNLGEQNLLRSARAIAAWCWINQMTMGRLRDVFPRLSLMKLRRLGETMSMLIGTLNDLWRSSYAISVDRSEREKLTRQLWLFGRALYHGVPLLLAPLPTIVSYSPIGRDDDLFPNLVHRESYMRLWRAVDGRVLPDDLLAAARQSSSPLQKHSTWKAIEPHLQWWSAKASELRRESPAS